MKNYYNVLQIPEHATPEAIRMAFRELAKTHHPDKNPGDIRAEDRFKLINEAYMVLSDPSKRKSYDYRLYRIREDAYQKQHPRQPEPNAWSSGPQQRAKQASGNTVGAEKDGADDGFATGILVAGGLAIAALIAGLFFNNRKN